MANLIFSSGSMVDKVVWLDDDDLEGHVWYIDQDALPVPLRTLYNVYGVAPDQILRMTPEVAVDRVQFGDGYAQLGKAGLNVNRLIFTVTFGKRDSETTAALRKFFSGDPGGAVYDREPDEFFWWLVPPPYGDDGADPLKFTCTQWEIKGEQYNSFTTTANFEQYFDSTVWVP